MEITPKFKKFIAATSMFGLLVTQTALATTMDNANDLLDRKNAMEATLVTLEAGYDARQERWNDESLKVEACVARQQNMLDNIAILSEITSKWAAARSYLTRIEELRVIAGQKRTQAMAVIAADEPLAQIYIDSGNDALNEADDKVNALSTLYMEIDDLFSNLVYPPSPACDPGSCGDDFLDLEEECDDGNTNNGDYCSADCSTVTSVCGDNTQELNEQCDDGNTDNGDYCSSDCSEVTTVCGDWATAGTEACDDGNTSNGDYCSASCDAVTTVCGDWNVEGSEQCDDGNTDSLDGCSSSCEME